MIKKLLTSVLSLALTLIICTGRTYAAGNASVTMQVAPNPVATNADVELRFYVTASGANIYGVSFTVNLVNLTYQYYDSTGTDFNGFSGVPSGNSAGSTTFEIAASYKNTASGSGQLYIGRVIARAAGTASTGQINIGSIQPIDTNFEAMTPSSQNGAVAIQMPASPPQTCPTGQTGTPPNCTYPSPGTSQPNNTNPTSNPNSRSIVTIPSNTDSQEAQAVPESELAEAFSSFDESDPLTLGDLANSIGIGNKWRTYGVIAGCALLGGALLMLLNNSARKRKELLRHIAPGANLSLKTPKPPATPPAKNSDGTNSEEPTIIRPQS